MRTNRHVSRMIAKIATKDRRVVNVARIQDIRFLFQIQQGQNAAATPAELSSRAAGQLGKFDVLSQQEKMGTRVTTTKMRND